MAVLPRSISRSLLGLAVGGTMMFGAASAQASILAVDSASGSGTFTYGDPAEFTFDASGSGTNVSGSVSVVYHHPSGDEVRSGPVTCLNVNGNQATIGFTDVPHGGDGLLLVQDGPDRIARSQTDFGGSPVCYNPADYGFPEAAFRTPETGDITVFDAPAGPPPAVVSGQGSTSPGNAKAQQFTISSLNQGGTLSYTGANATFNGTIQCVNIVGNAATIVAVDSTTGLANRTMVQDNGASGDKLVNTLFDPSKLTPAVRAKNLACIAPDTAKLSAAPALAGDAIQISGTT